MRADRLISILMYLQTEGRLTAKELSARLEVSQRTIYRDIDALSAAGVPVYTDPGNGGGISLPPEYRTRADGLTTSEVQALFLHQAGQPMNELGIGDSLRSGLLKLLNALPGRQRLDAEWIRDRVHLDSDAWKPQDIEAGNLQLAQQAVWEQRIAFISYTDRSGQSSAQRIEPYGLVAKAGIWFLVGLSDHYVRAYRFNRISSIELLEERFDRPEGFNLPEYWKRWLSRYRGMREDGGMAP